MLRSGIRETFCLRSSVKGPPELHGALSCSLDSRLPAIELPLPACGEVAIDIDGLAVKQVDFPPDVLWRVVRLVGRQELKSLHRVNRAWRDAVCQGLESLIVKGGTLSLLQKFPNIGSIALEGVSLKQADIRQLRSLQSLVMRNCACEAPMSDLACLKGLQRLRLVNVSGSDGDCETVFAKLEDLTFLEWRKPPMLSTAQAMPGSMSFPCSKLASLTSLKVLLLSESFQGVQAQNLSQISNLQGLSRLAITGGALRETTASAIALLPQMQSLELSNCNDLFDESVQMLSVLTDLTKLDLRLSSRFAESVMTDRGAVQLSMLTNLQYLNLAGHSHLTTEGVSHISSCTGLSSLCLAGVGLWTGGAEFLRPLTGLQFLNISRSLLTSQQLLALQPLTALQHLNLSETYLNNEAAEQVAKMVHLETLKISYCPMGNRGFRLITASCPKLSRVTIEGCWISTWCLLCIVLQHHNLKFWADDDFWLPQWMRKLDVIMIAQTQPFSRKLRALYQAEDTLWLSIIVGLGVTIFAALYTGVLLMLFTAIFLLPMFFLGILSLVVMAAAFAAKIFAGVNLHAPCLLQKFEALLFSGPDSEGHAPQERIEDLL